MGATLITDVVSSTSGDYNQILTLTTGGLTTNMYKGFLVSYSGNGRKLNYIISSNTADTITLTTPTTAYIDLTHVTINIKVPSDYFGLNEADVFPEIEAFLNVNSTYGMTDELPSSQLKVMLPNIEGAIHQYVGIINPLAETDLGFEVIRQVILSSLKRWNIVRQASKIGNQIDSISTYVPFLDATEYKMLNDIKPDDRRVCRVYDQKHSYGKGIIISNSGGYYE